MTGNKDRPFVVALAEAVAEEGMPVLRMSFTGNGNSGGRFEDCTISKEVEDLKAVLAAIEPSGLSVTFAGHSMGGYVSLEFLRKFPKMLKAVVLINSTPAEDSVEKKAIRDKSVRLVGRNKKA